MDKSLVGKALLSSGGKGYIIMELKGNNKKVTYPLLLFAHMHIHPDTQYVLHPSTIPMLHTCTSTHIHIQRSPCMHCTCTYVSPPHTHMHTHTQAHTHVHTHTHTPQILYLQVKILAEDDLTLEFAKRVIVSSSVKVCAFQSTCVMCMLSHFFWLLSFILGKISSLLAYTT